MRIILFLLSTFIILQAQLLHRPSYSDENSRLLIIPYSSVISYLPVTKIYDISEDQSYYYLASNGGIWRYHKYDQEWDYPITTSQGLPQNTILHIYYWSDRDVLYAETPGYHCLFNPTWEMWQNLPKKGKNLSWPGGISLDDLRRSMTANKAEKIKRVSSMPNQAALTDDRRYTMRGDAVLISPAGEAFPLTYSFTSFLEDIIFVIEGFGIGMSNEYDVSIKLFRLSVPNVPLRDILIDGNLFWFGGVGRTGYNSYGAIGLWPDLKNSWEYYYKLNSNAFANSFSVNRFYADRNNLYAATDNGILEYDNGADEWQTLPGTSNKAYSKIKYIAKLDSILWLGTDDGLIAWDPEIKQFMYRNSSLSNTRIYNLESDNNDLYIASNQGLYRLRHGSLIPEGINYLTTVVGGLPKVVRSLKNELWIGTDMGWVWYDKKSGKWNGDLISNFRLKGPVMDMAVDNRDAFFLVPAGVVHWNRKTDVYRLYNKKSGIPSGSYRRIILDGNALWVLYDDGATQIFFEEVKY